VVGGGPGPDTNLAAGRPTAESSHNQNFVSANAVDGDANSYWESANNAFPQWIQVDLGSAATVNRVVLRLPSSWGTRTQTLTVQGSTNGSTFTTAVGSAAYTFSQGTNAVTISVPGTSMRYVRINVTANTGWPAAQVSQFEVYGGAANPGDTQAPSPPGQPTVTGHTATSATLSWSASSDNVGVTGYQVLRGGTVVASPT